MKLKGIKRGQYIEIVEDISNIPDDTEVIIDISSYQFMSIDERQQKLKDFFESDWEGREDYIKTMEELEEEKKANWEKLYGHFS
ncbi:hypothetical protein NUACC21_36850 [Scytonema sp. NUACC21]